MVSRDVKESMDSVSPENRWMHAYTYSGHPTCCAVGIKNVEIMERERLWENAARMGHRLYEGLRETFGEHPHVGDIRGGKGLLAAIELVEDRSSKASFPSDKKMGPRVNQEMMKRGVVTRVRADSIFFAPPLVITEAQVDRLITITRDSVKAVLGI
jgi:adenosylmethionine-8-amino-7-oxononanoate aminotransferase